MMVILEFIALCTCEYEFGFPKKLIFGKKVVFYKV